MAAKRVNELKINQQNCTTDKDKEKKKNIKQSLGICGTISEV